MPLPGTGEGGGAREEGDTQAGPARQQLSTPVTPWAERAPGPGPDPAQVRAAEAWEGRVTAGAGGRRALAAEEQYQADLAAHHAALAALSFL